MHYYQFNPSAYCLDTAHLSNKEDLAYRRLLDLAYTSEKELPLDITLLARKVRCGAAEVESVIGEFFTKTEAGYVNERVQLELTKLKEFVEAGKAGAEKRWGKKKKSPPTESDMASDSPPINGYEQKDSPLMLPITYNLEPNSPVVPDGDIQKELIDQDQLLHRAKMLFRMRSSTQLDSAQLRSWKKNKGAVASTSDEEWLLLEWLYAQPSGAKEPGEYRRKDLSTLLSNWNGEIQRARNEATQRGFHTQKKEKAPAPAPAGWKDELAEICDGSDPEMIESASWDQLTPALRGQIEARLEEIVRAY
jgi:uncharacterized protein YdaU (DUF1376 family)